MWGQKDKRTESRTCWFPKFPDSLKSLSAELKETNLSMPVNPFSFWGREVSTRQSRLDRMFPATENFYTKSMMEMDYFNPRQTQPYSSVFADTPSAAPIVLAATVVGKMEDSNSTSHKNPKQTYVPDPKRPYGPISPRSPLWGLDLSQPSTGISNTYPPHFF